MRFGKIFKLFQKGSKAASKQKGKKGEAGGFSWPSGLRVGVFGHANAGKTVYFTVLNEECKISKDLQISVTDNATAGEFLFNYRSLWGVGTASGVGTVVDLKGEKKFPEPTGGDKLLLFNAILDKKKKVSVVTYDYNGKAVSIIDRIDLKDKVIDFMSGCNGILFFYDAKFLGAELPSHEQAASYVSMLEYLAPLNKRLPIPIALVVSKADILPGFTGEGQTVLVGPENENLFSEDFETFFERILESNKVAANSAWAGTVRNVLVRLKEFLKVVTGRTLDFQIFFVSNTGQTPEKIGSDIGRSIYAPPPKIHPVGVKEPFYWLLKSVIRNRRISRMRTVARFVTFISILWLIFYSLPHLYHFNYLLPRATRVESSILETYKGNAYNTSDDERRRIISAYNKYADAWTVDWIFPMFQTPSRRISEGYKSLNMASATEDLNKIIKNFTGIVGDTTLWPKLNPSDSTLDESDIHRKLKEDLSNFHQGDEKSILFTRSGRALAYWDLFTRSIMKPSDTAVWISIAQQVQHDRNMYGKEMSNEEVELGKVLSDRKMKKVQIATAQKAASDLSGLIPQINGNENGAFRLDSAVKILQESVSKLDPAADKGNIDMINRYLQSVNRWNKRQKFVCKIEVLPEKSHVHIEVTDKGKDPLWEEHNQTMMGDSVTIYWKAGDDIHIAIDLNKHKCKWGKEPSDKTILKGKYSIFEMEGEVSFDNIGKRAGISFMPPLVEQLPVLK